MAYTKTAHALALLETVQNLKTQQFICDFVVEVGLKKFPVHRVILAGSSEYFLGLFSSGMKEVREGKIVVKELSERAVESCIDYIYSGDVQLDMDSVQDVLKASHLMQLERLSNLVFDFMSNNISPKNCLVVKSVADLYGNSKLSHLSEKVAIGNFQEVLSEEAFFSLKVIDLMKYLPKVGFKISWQAVISWSRCKGNNFEEISKKLCFRSYPFQFLLEVILKEPLVQGNDQIKEDVVKAIFCDINKVKSNIQLTNCIELRKISESRNLGLEMDNLILCFMANNFREVSNQHDFNQLSKPDVLNLLKSNADVHSDEKVKWQAMMYWLKGGKKKRRSFFRELFTCINLKNFDLKFLQNTVRKEQLVKECLECTELLMQAVFEKAEELSKENEMLRQTTSRHNSNVSGDVAAKQTTGDTTSSDSISKKEKPTSRLKKTTVKLEGNEIRCEVLQSSLPGYSGWPTFKITYVISEGQKLGICYQKHQFEAYLPKIDHLYGLLEKAFYGGHTFNLTWIPGQTVGLVTWGKIPHITSLAGGPRNNGFPNKDYASRLEEALMACGIIAS